MQNLFLLPNPSPGQPTIFYSDALGQWERGVSAQFLPLEVTSRSSVASFQGRTALVRFGDSVVADIQSSAHKVTRTRRLAADSSARFFKICWQLTGRSLLEQNGRSVIVEPGQWAMYDTSQSYTLETSDASRFMMLLLPQTEAVHWVPHIHQIAGVALKGQGTAALVRAALAELLTGNHPIESYGQAVLQDSVLALMSTAIRQVVAELQDSKRSIDSRLEHALAYINAHLTDPDLTPDSVANACGISRRSLYATFDLAGQTPHAYIISQRLRIAKQLLADAGTPDKLITHIAYELGFADAAHFSRAFHERFGVTPSQWRASSRNSVARVASGF